MFGCLKSDDSWDLTVALGKDAKKRNLRDCICKCICCVKRLCKVDSCDEDLVRTPAQGLKTKQDLLAASAPSASFAQRLSVLCIPELFKVMTTVQNKAPLINPYFSEGLACFTRPLHCPFLHISTTSSTAHAPKSNLDTSIVHSSPLYQNALHIMDEPSLSEAHPPPASVGEVNEDHQTKQAHAQADRSDSCSSCSKPAKYVCIFCERAPAATGYPLWPTHYRSVECQTTDREHHEVCKAARDRQLIRERGSATEGTPRVLPRLCHGNGAGRNPQREPHGHAREGLRATHHRRHHTPSRHEGERRRKTRILRLHRRQCSLTKHLQILEEASTRYARCPQ